MAYSEKSNKYTCRDAEPHERSIRKLAAGYEEGDAEKEQENSEGPWDKEIGGIADDFVWPCWV